MKRSFEQWLDAYPFPDNELTPRVEALAKSAFEAGQQSAPEREAIIPGDWVEPIDRDLDPREVAAVGLDWIMLDILGTITDPLPLANYRIVRRKEEVFARVHGEESL
jgi:hypothetical protein